MKDRKYKITVTHFNKKREVTVVAELRTKIVSESRAEKLAARELANYPNCCVRIEPI